MADMEENKIQTSKEQDVPVELQSVSHDSVLAAKSVLEEDVSISKLSATNVSSEGQREERPISDNLEERIKNRAFGKKQSESSGTARPRVKPDISDILAGEAKDFNANFQPHLPSDLIGGSIPHVFGTEDEAVWNTAAQACGTERVHYTYSIEGGRIWYLACPSSSLASNPDSWCPLAAALPGNGDHWDKETVYLYEQEGMAAALRWDPETGRMQVFLGATRTILPRMQSMDANFVTINPDTAEIAKWHNRTLHTEKLSRAVVRMLILIGMSVNAVAAIVLFVSVIALAFVHSDLNLIKKQTDLAALKLMKNAAEVMQSDTIRHMVRIQRLLDNLSQSNGYMVSYEVVGKRTEWNAIVPIAFSDQARTDTTYLDVVGNRVKKVVPKIKREDDENVRLIGTK